jgi:hypothetical protein
MAPITRYRECESVKLLERSGLTVRVWVYPSACSMGIVRLRFKLDHQIDEGVRAPSPSNLWPPMRSGNVTGERESDVVGGTRAAALVVGRPPGESTGRLVLALLQWQQRSGGLAHSVRS